jgi:hypothetical protein
MRSRGHLVARWATTAEVQVLFPRGLAEEGLRQLASERVLADPREPDEQETASQPC